MLKRILGVAVTAAVFLLSAQAQTKLLRFPDIHGNQVVFSYGGDLWTASAAGGAASRLTAHPGLELFAKFSPDGKWIAFTGQYDGDEQVYACLLYTSCRRSHAPFVGFLHHGAECVHAWRRQES